MQEYFKHPGACTGDQIKGTDFQTGTLQYKDGMFPSGWVIL